MKSFSRIAEIIFIYTEKDVLICLQNRSLDFILFLYFLKGGNTNE